MANHWFQFQHFRVEQDRCAMKVSTDACIQGALAADFLSRINGESLTTMLDIGTGTGLLSLMVCQKHPQLRIHAIDIDLAASEQAASNFESSPWPQNLAAVHSSLQEWRSASEAAIYDFVICNPPFFKKHLQSAERRRNLARHDLQLPLTDLMEGARFLLSPGGYFCILYPAFAWPNVQREAEKNHFFLCEQIEIRPRSNMPANRVVAFFSKKKGTMRTRTLTIYEGANTFTSDFAKLLSAYYLQLAPPRFPTE